MHLLSRLATLSMLVIPSLASASAPYGMAGCGLGSIIFEPNSCQSSAATTNGSYSNQAFGISFGTSNCVGGGSKSLVENIQRQFFADNFETIAKEMAQGQGETLVAFAEIMGCDQGSRADFAEAMQAAYQDIYAAPGIGASLAVVRDTLETHPDLSEHCAII